MNQTRVVRMIVLAIVAIAFPLALWADLTETTILQTGSALNLDTGAVVSSAGDLLWNGSSLAPQGSATAVVLYSSATQALFNTTPELTVELIPGYSKAAISSLGVGAMLGVHTNGGHWAKLLVTANSGGNITLESTSFGVTGTGSGTGGPPTITSVENNSSLIPAGLPNSGIAPSSIFVVQGSGLADAGTPVLQDTQASGGLPLTLNGASITVVVGGVTIHPAFYYTSPTQLAAVLPAATPVGTGTLTVNYKGTNSTPFPIQVVPSAVGISQFNQIPIPGGVYNTNVAVGVATDNSTGAVLTFTNSGTPGQTVVVWTTGLGADPADSDNAYIPAPHAINTPMQVYLGGVLLNVLYQGATVYPGVDVIIFTIPASAPNSCYVPLAAVTGQVISNVVILPIHQGGGTCVEPETGGSTTGDQILKNTQDTLKAGLVSVIQTNVSNAKGTTVTNSAGADFFKDSGLLAAAVGRSGILAPGGCSVYPVVAAGQLTIAGLDSGSMSVTGPTGPAIPLPIQLGIKGQYGAILAAGAIPATGGTFTFAGSGGADVGPFTSTVTFSNPLFNWTNQSAATTVDRTQGLTYTWTGGLRGTYVILGGTSTASGVTAGFSCRVAVEAGQFTVPSYILLGLPAGSGGTSIQQQDTVSTFSATGLDAASVMGVIEYSVNTTYK